MAVATRRHKASRIATLDGKRSGHAADSMPMKSADATWPV